MVKQRSFIGQVENISKTIVSGAIAILDKKGATNNVIAATIKMIAALSKSIQFSLDEFFGVFAPHLDNAIRDENVET
jgi:hypothetical protein